MRINDTIAIIRHVPALSREEMGCTIISMTQPSDTLWQYLSIHQRELLEDAERILEKSVKEELPLHDYSYIVFPYAKAYEGFLKRLFYDLEFIDKKTYLGERFRIGKALNPDLPKTLEHESVYHKITLYCTGDGLADELWSVWKKGRNLVVHYFPHNYRKLTLDEALNIREEIIAVMEKAILGCSITIHTPAGQ